MPVTRAVATSAVHVTITLPGSSEGDAVRWKAVSGGATLLQFSDETNPTVHYPSTPTGMHRYEEAVITAEAPMPAAAQEWLAAAVGDGDQERDVLVELLGSTHGTVVSSTRFQNAVIVRYEGPKFDAGSRSKATEAIAFRFQSVIESLEPGHSGPRQPLA